MGRPQQVIQDADMEPQDETRGFDIPHRPLNVADMCRAFGISRATFYRWEKAHVFDGFLLRPVYRKKRWNGAQVARWRRGDAPMFGRKARA